MTDLNNLPPCTSSAQSPAAERASAPAQPPPDEAAEASVEAEAPLSPRAQVNQAILAFGATLGAANAIALSLEGMPLSVLPLTIAELCASLEDLTLTAVQVSSAVSIALAPAGHDDGTTPAATKDKDFLSLTAPWIAGNLYGVVPQAPLTAIPDRNEKWFAITRGRYVGLTTNSAVSLNAVAGVPSGLSDRCASQAEALQHFNVALAAHAVAIFDLRFPIGLSLLAPPLLSHLSKYMAGPPPPYVDPVDELLAGLTHLTIRQSATTDAPSPPHARFSRSPPRRPALSSPPTAVAPAPSTLSHVPSTPSRPSPRLYAYSSPTQSGVTAAWSQAAAATQGVPGGKVHLISKPAKKPRRKNAAYVVFFGRAPGVYNDWSQAEAQVKGARPAIHQGYSTRAAAVAAFNYALDQGWTRVCGSGSFPLPFTVQPAPLDSLPIPTSLMAAPSPLHGDGDGTWFVVFCGITPGVYESFLELSLNTTGLSCATYASFPTKSRAIAEFQEALQKGLVKIVTPSY
ncbi:hypothetical protein C8F04DRAFT_1278923 [Mycena alexandri]|uniref:Ribonuclease H1 N-terminal domain-containing protein n=1 Tax=Mycena alexandri TaxID=1745969 RepID=A0AAD6S007_9AGAR|nr:hypothetical protein C8F04DRAFT_1278923 [Mycena alexandri]